ncbi:MAG: type II secretion system protein [Planctomycetota bacterium]
MTSDNSSKRRPLTTMRRAAGGFTLIELLVVVAIIALVIAIVLPAIGGARNSARAATTQQLMTGVTNASQLFVQDNQRLPGYYSAVDMGSDENADASFSAMQNAMLELAGGLVFGATVTEDAMENRYRMGPYPTGDMRAQVVDLDLVGVAQEGVNVYFTPDPKNYEPQNERTGMQGDGSISNPNNVLLPSLVDSFGTPLLLWSQDGAGRTPRDWADVDADTFAFARVSSGSGTGSPERGFFYWNSNAAFLQATSTGRKQIDQNADSLLGGSFSDEERARTMAAVLGHPGFPKGDLSNLAAADVEDLIASAPRGAFIVHSAGRDGVYLAESDANDVLEGGERSIRYAANFFAGGGTERYTNAAGDVITEDVTSRFDDMVSSSGE